MAAKRIQTKTAKPGVWFPVGRLWHKDVCCDCGLAHKSEYGVEVVEKKDGTVKYYQVWQRAWRDEKLTRERRRVKKYSCQPVKRG